jgi:hypothetical protein
MTSLMPPSATIIIRNSFLSLAFLSDETSLMTNFLNLFPKEFLLMLYNQVQLIQANLTANLGSEKE